MQKPDIAAMHVLDQQVYGSDESLANKLRNLSTDDGLLRINEMFRDTGKPWIITLNHGDPGKSSDVSPYWCSLQGLPKRLHYYFISFILDGLEQVLSNAYFSRFCKRTMYSKAIMFEPTNESKSFIVEKKAKIFVLPEKPSYKCLDVERQTRGHSHRKQTTWATTTIISSERKE